MSINSWQRVVDVAAEQLGATQAEILAAIKVPMHPANMRDEFAIAALPAVVAKYAYATNAAETAYEIADAMLAERIKAK